MLLVDREGREGDTQREWEWLGGRGGRVGRAGLDGCRAQALLPPGSEQLYWLQGFGEHREVVLLFWLFLRWLC